MLLSSKFREFEYLNKAEAFAEKYGKYKQLSVRMRASADQENSEGNTLVLRDVVEESLEIFREMIPWTEYTYQLLHIAALSILL